MNLKEKMGSIKLKIGIAFLYLGVAYFGLQTLTSNQHDEFVRMVSSSGKQEVVCPTQQKDTGVLLVIGQSNSANYAEKKYTTEFPDKVVNYFNGHCYVASSPLLGASHNQGEFITAMADKLIRNGTFQNVVVISSGIGGSPISRWEKDGDLNKMLLGVVTQFASLYKATDIIWHQGEADFLLGTSKQEYYRAFHSLVDSLEGGGVRANIFIAIATKCGVNPSWKAVNPVALGQAALVDSKQIFLGANTDALLEKQDRQIGDDCHFSESGQEKTANAFADSIKKAHQSQ